MKGEKVRIRSACIALLIVFAAGFVMAGSDDVQAFLKVSPLGGETKTTKSGGSKGLIRSTPTSTQNTSKSVSRNMKWNCEVRYRGEPRPEKVEVKVFYIGYEGKEMTAKVLGKDTKSLTLDANGKASVELESPTVTFSKSRTSSGSTGRSGSIAKTRTTVRGKRIAGCVVQLWDGSEMVKSYSSMSQWANAAKDKDFGDASLNRKEKNRLN